MSPETSVISCVRVRQPWDQARFPVLALPGVGCAFLSVCKTPLRTIQQRQNKRSTTQYDQTKHNDGDLPDSLQKTLSWKTRCESPGSPLSRALFEIRASLSPSTTAHMSQALANPHQIPALRDLSEGHPGFKTPRVCCPNFPILRHC